MSTIIGNIAYGASPSQEDFRVFESQAALTAYLSSARAKAGQTVKVKDANSNKYKALIIQGTAGHFTTQQMGGSYVVDSQLPEVENADADTDYYIGSSATGFAHYKLIGDEFIAMDGGLMKLIDPSIDGIDVPSANSEPDTQSEEFLALNIGQIFTCTINNKVTYWIKQDDNNFTGLGSGGGLAFDGGYVSEGKLHLTLNNVDIEGYEPIDIPAGTGSSDSTVRITNSMSSSRLTVLSSASAYQIRYSWTSVDAGTNQPTQGTGTAFWYVNGARVATTANISQGAQSFDIRPHLTESTNTVKLTVEDSYGTSKSFTWTVIVSNVSLTWNVDDIEYHGAEALTLKITPSGVGTKAVAVTVDGTSVYSQSGIATSGRALSVTIPAQSHGAHTIIATMTISSDGDTIATTPLSHTGIWSVAGNTAPIIAFFSDTADATQYETTDIHWMAYDPSNPVAAVTLKDGNTVVASLNVDRSVQTWSYRPTTSGEHTLTAICGSESDSITVNVAGIGIDVSPITDGILMDLDPTGHSNSEASRASFGYKDGQGTNHPLTFSANFDWQNGGFQRDERGAVAFVVKRGTSVTFDRSLFLASDNTNGELGVTGTGKHISMIFKTKNVTDYETQIAHSYNSGTGLRLNAHSADFIAGNSIVCQYCEDRTVEFALNIDPTNATMKLWLEGTPAKGTTFLTGGTKTQFIQGAPDAFTIGSNDCDVWVYRFKMYRNYLTDREILQNFIADAANVSEMLARFNRNDIYDSNGISISKLMTAAPNLHILTIETAGFPGDKGSAGNTDCKIVHQLGNGTAEDQWYAEGAKYTLQGTSSMNYRQCAGNLDINMKKTTMKVLSTDATLNGYAMTANSIPVKYFNLKANVASSEHANNVCAADLFNTFNPLVSKAKSENSRCRDTVEGHPCAVFIKNTGNSPLLLGVNGARTVPAGETILYFVGDMNNSKKNTEVFGQTSEWNDEDHQQCCIEFLENTYTRCTFKTSDFQNEGWKEDGTALPSHFEFRYPDGAGTQAMKNKFIEMHNWVNSTDPEQATNEALTAQEQFDEFTTDTAAYRRAKFKREVSDYFDLDNLLFYYLFTEFFLAVDNRAKNLFCSYEPDENGVWRWNLSKNYDNDTILGIDNKGQFRWGEAYGIEDTDGYEDIENGETVTRPYFNAAENVLFCNIRDCFSAELATAYNRYENEGLFNADTVIDKFDNYQRIRPEALVIEDYAGKYDAPITNANNSSWMEDMEHGEKRPQRRQFLTYRELFMSSKYFSAGAKADTIRYQAMPGSNFSSALEVTPYSDMYVGILRDNTPAGSLRIKKGHTSTVQCLDGNGNPLVLHSGELNIQLINGRNLMHIGGAAYLYPGQVSVTNGEKLQDLLLGDNSYTSNNLKSISLDAVPLVKKLDLRGQFGIAGVMDLSACHLLEELYLAGTGMTDVYLPQSAKLTKALLGANVRTLYARNLPNLTSLNFSCSGVNLTSLWVENAPGIPTDTLVTNAENLVRGRITNADWNLPNADVLLRLATLKGIDASGNPLEAAGSFYVSGQAHLDVITQTEIDTLSAAFPDLTVTYDAIVPSYTVTFEGDDGTILCTQAVRQGSNAKDPVAAGDISTPTKAPTTDYTYTFIGWSPSLENVTTDRTVTAAFNQTVRTYTVTYYNGLQVLEAHQVEAHDSCSYEGADLVDPDGKIWLGFDREATNVVSDMDINAVFLTPVLPSSVPAGSYDYLYSDDANDTSAYTFAEFCGVIKNNRCKDYFSIGDKIKITASSTVFSDTMFVLQLEHFNHYKMADNSGDFAPVSFGMIGIMNATKQMNSTATNTGGWRDCDLRAWLNNTVFPELPRHWKAIIANVIVLSSQGEESTTIISSEDWLYLRSMAEVGFRTTENPYMYEVDADADDKKSSLYTDDNSRIKKYYNNTGSAKYWWLRSPWLSNSTNFAYVLYNGDENNNNASNSAGVSFGLSFA